MVDGNPRDLRFRQTSRLETTRRSIQHEFIKELTDSGFTFTNNEVEPRGIQAKVLRSVNNMYHGRTKLKTNRQQVSDWVNRVRKNSYRVTSVKQDYSNSSQNRRKVFDHEIQSIRNRIRQKELKCNEVVSVFSDKKNKQVTVSASTIRRCLKRPFRDEPSMVAARPKGMKVGGNTAHHNKCRKLEAEYWSKQG